METALKIIIFSAILALVLHYAPPAWRLVEQYLPQMAASVSLPFPTK